MALSEVEKELVIQMLDELDDRVRRIVLASLEALAEWLRNVAYAIFQKIRPMLQSFWQWLKSLFA
ncbi:MAG: hypothetical protein JF614_23165 [Acidobacteria bacterium]|nr:hypothetical protein [Acidobacteriota bacterium]